MQEHRYFPPAGWGKDTLCRPVLLQKGLKPFGGWPAAPEGRAGLYRHPPLHHRCGSWPVWVLSHGRGGQAEGRVRGPRRMQMAGGLSGHCWSPLVCRRAACSRHAGEPQDSQHISQLQQGDGLVIKRAHLLLEPWRKMLWIRSRKQSWASHLLDEGLVARY